MNKLILLGLGVALMSCEKPKDEVIELDCKCDFRLILNANGQTRIGITKERDCKEIILTHSTTIALVNENGEHEVVSGVWDVVSQELIEENCK